MTRPGHLQLERISVEYPNEAGVMRAVDAVSLMLAPGEIGCLLGPSGCGKTTVLRAIAGFEPIVAGSIRLAGRIVAQAETGLPPEKRRVGMMFQDYALFPHLDVAANVAFGLRTIPRAVRTARVEEMLSLMGLAGRGGTFPHALSGGQQQRVALARALAPNPDVLLLDEPFSSLDAHTRHRLTGELRELLKVTGTTVLMVTHDQTEAFSVADSIGVMREGALMQWGSAQQLYQEPASALIGQFIDNGTVVNATVVGLSGSPAVIRPEHLSIDASGPIEAVVVDWTFQGPDFSVRLRLTDGSLVRIRTPIAPAFETGTGVRLRLTARPIPRIP